MFTICFCTSFKQDILQAQQNVLTNTIKLALYTSSATIGHATTAYTTTNEISGAGYTAGGITLSGANIWTDGTTVGFTFTNPTFGPMTASNIQSGLLYNSTVSNKAVGVIGFASPLTCTNQSLELLLPASTTNTGFFKLIG